MYTVMPDGSIKCETPEEAIKLSRAITTTQPAPQPETQQTRLPFRIARKRISSPSDQILNILRPYNGQTVDSTQMAKILGTDGTTGVGTKIRHMRNTFLEEGKQLEQYLVPTKTETGYSAWEIHIESTLPSA